MNEFNESEGIFTNLLIKSIEEIVSLDINNKDKKLGKILYNLIDSIHNSTALNEQERKRLGELRIKCSYIANKSA